MNFFKNTSSEQTIENLETQLRADTEALATPTGRRVGQPGHEAAKEYILQRLHEIGLQPFSGDNFELPYEGTLYDEKKAHTFTNLVGVVPGSDRNLPPLLIGAHYDSVIDAPCADDNATSVACNLAIAEMAQNWNLKRDLIIAIFDAEEPPYFLTKHMGSTRFYEDHCACNGIDFAGVIVTDLIGHDFAIPETDLIPSMVRPLLPDVSKYLFMMGAESNTTFPTIVKQVIKRHSKLDLLPVPNKYVGSVSDHHIFNKNGQPFLFFSCGQGKYYHHKLDTIDWINFPKLARITELIAEILKKLDILPAEKESIPQHIYDASTFEVDMIKKSVGSLKLGLILKAFNKKMPKNRKDLDDLCKNII